MRQGPWAVHITIHARTDGAATYKNMPVANSFLFNSHRHITLVDTEGMSLVRLKVNKQGTAGAAGAKLTVKYSPTFSTNVSNYVDLGVTEVSVPIDNVNTFLDSGWIEISPDTHADDIFLAIVGSGGNGTLDPQFGHISVSMA
ncbi:hypothetical protein KC951_02315 [Candidatus Saccharibacteria bacterium]|nr:hypothetical protein [Candidatus Saccharibacteria bacterium]